MNINDMREENKFTTFSELSPGDVFTVHGKYYMKVVLRNSRNINCIDLRSGEKKRKRESRRVAPLEVELVIKSEYPNQGD